MTWLTAVCMALMLSGCLSLPLTHTGTPFNGPGTEVGKNALQPGTEVRFFHAQAPEEIQLRTVARQLGKEGFETTAGETIRFENVIQIEFFQLDSNARMRVDSVKESALMPVVLVCMAVGGCGIQ